MKRLSFTEKDARDALFPRGARREEEHFAHKGTYGYIALIGGSERYSGAIRLANMAENAAASVRSGCGVCTLAAPAGLGSALRPLLLESTLFPLSDDGRANIVFREEELKELSGRCKAIACGMGIGNSEETRKLVAWLLKSFEGTLILDADGINALAEISARGEGQIAPKLIITPHLAEFSRLTGYEIAEIEKRPADIAEEYARKSGAIVLLKGAVSYATDGCETYEIERGCPGMASGGSGDVLSGIMAAVCGMQETKDPKEPQRGKTLLRAAAAAAYINGLAGELAERELGAISMAAGDTVSHIPEALRLITEGEGGEKTRKDTISISPIAYLRCDFHEKFGIPRQAGLIPEIEGKIVFEPEYRDDNALRGLEGYSHIWLIWGFSEGFASGARPSWHPTVRPPMLGGNLSMGVFATRSPDRPNPLALSAVRLKAVVKERDTGSVLLVQGADLMDGTPIYDIKPYLPFADSIEDARGGFAEGAREEESPLKVIDNNNVLVKLPENKRPTLIKILEKDPRPRYHRDPEREYGLSFAGFNIRFKMIKKPEDQGFDGIELISAEEI